MTNPLITVLIPTYNRARFLGVAAASALLQTYGNIEVIILDDASSDETPAVGAALVRADPRVTFVRRTHNLGIACNWRDGISRVRGEFFCLLHDDDTLHPTFLEKLIDPLLKDAGIILSFSDHWVMDERGSRLDAISETVTRQFRRDRLRSGIVVDLARAVLIDFAIPVGATLFRRCTVSPGMIDPSAHGAIDYWLFYQCFRTGYAAHYVPERLMNYRLHSGGMSTSMKAYMLAGHLHRLSTAIRDPSIAWLWPELRTQFARASCDQGIALCAASQSAEARKHLWRSLNEQPSIRALVAFIAAHLGPAGRRLVMLSRRSKQKQII